MAKRSSGRRSTPGVHHEVLLDNEHVQVVRWTLMPGATTPSYKHPHSYVVHPRTSGELRRDVKQGRTRVSHSQKLVAGKPYHRPVDEKGLVQSLTNVGKGPIVFEKMTIRPHGGGKSGGKSGRGRR